MRCLLCENFSFSHICPTCRELFLSPSIYKRKISKDIEVISFYKYDEIKTLLHTKHTDIGHYIYSILAKESFKKFADNFEYENKIASLSIDDYTDYGYSHTALLNKELRSNIITPYFNKLKAQNRVNYSGKPKEFRLLNPRNFKFDNFKEKEVILVDDIITTGSTFSQAIQTLKKHKKTPILCLALADARK